MGLISIISLHPFIPVKTPKKFCFQFDTFQVMKKKKTISLYLKCFTLVVLVYAEVLCHLAIALITPLSSLFSSTSLAKMKAELILTGPHINMDNPILKQ